MKIARVLMGMSAGVLVLALTGCSFSVFGHGSGPRGSVYVDRGEPEYVIVRDAPPPRREEHRPTPPSRGHIWIDGYWAWTGREYVWEPGHWAVPPRERAVWVEPRYDRDDHGYRFRPGYWKDRDRH